jgi:hypothetical protein
VVHSDKQITTVFDATAFDATALTGLSELNVLYIFEIRPEEINIRKSNHKKEHCYAAVHATEDYNLQLCLLALPASEAYIKGQEAL